MTANPDENLMRLVELAERRGLPENADAHDYLVLALSVYGVDANVARAGAVLLSVLWLDDFAEALDGCL